ncbi:Cytoplasmic tRNA 2-thiolation protein 2 [Araneus ventricosus]|uniref:Cytoplasmic tRNA 2-thiolation protein 2 n=1 Tax=Araneus ventricosus TaxID=182803 RepID=A0A4Y2N629_ARAVE|nr:Cytoplasmic tRNA 2-thiolation protein 2 [Araneus ventricosus]GBN35507.1 Cytoplasmic tRNA 2-thiolation protein 2 [Araneus ventricosus]
MSKSESISQPLEDERKNLHGILNELKSYGYPVLCSSLEMVCKLNGNQDIFWNFSNIDLVNDFPVCADSKNCIQECMEDMSLSAKIDFIKHIRLLLITNIASRCGFKHVFVGDTSCSLAENLLTDINLGRGSQISADTNFYDTRFKVPVCRPLREFLNKEVALYLHLHNCSYTVLPDLLTKTDTKSSIQRLTESFITNLQEDFPATVFTIFRTGGKLSKQDGMLGSQLCFLCMSKLDNIEPDPCSALEALKLSEKLSKALNDVTVNSVPDAVNGERSSPLSSDFENQNLLKFLCHGCSVAFRNNKRSSKFSPFLKQMKRNEMKEDIKDFLINAEGEAS